MELLIQPIPSFGTLIPVEEFIEMVECGLITDEDGFGRYATSNTFVENVYLDIESVDTSFTHILWFNK